MIQVKLDVRTFQSIDHKMGRRGSSRSMNRWLHQLNEFKQELLDAVLLFLNACISWIYKVTLPVTSVLFARCPSPPTVLVKDVRANRIRLELHSSYSSPFNKEDFEIEWAAAGSDDWTSVGVSGLKQRTVARLKDNTLYQFRARAQGIKGLSRWSAVVESRTKIAPHNGGGTGEGFVWEQSAGDVTIMFELPEGTTKKDVLLQLKPESIFVAVKQPDGTNKVLLEGELWGRVQSWDNGSCWELAKEGRSKVVLTITMEKVSKSVAPKFDYWRAVIPGQHEIDTHQIASDPDQGGMKMINPGQQYDPQQLKSMGLKGI